MANSQRLGLALLSGAALAALVAASWVLAPRAPEPLRLGEPRALGAEFDPHLVLALAAPSWAEGPGGRELRLRATARNSAVGGELDLSIEGLRFALEDARGARGAEVAARWTDDAGREVTLLAAGESATADVALPASPGVTARAVIVRRHVRILDWIPIARGSLLDPRLRFELAGV